MLEFLFTTCQSTFLNAKRLVITAMQLFDEKKYEIATFCAMTAIEEIGKVVVLRTSGLGVLDELSPDWFSKQKKIFDILHNHTGKALEMANLSLFLNKEAEKRHGTHPISGVHRTSGIILLVHSKNWMKLRNSCLYTDVNLNTKTVNVPLAIGREHAYYFICMAFEGLIEQSFLTPGCQNNEVKAYNASVELQKKLETFMFKNATNVDELDFLQNPAYYRKLFKNCGGVSRQLCKWNNPQMIL